MTTATVTDHLLDTAVKSLHKLADAREAQGYNPDAGWYFIPQHRNLEPEDWAELWEPILDWTHRELYRKAEIQPDATGIFTGPTKRLIRPLLDAYADLYGHTPTSDQARFLGLYINGSLHDYGLSVRLGGNNGWSQSYLINPDFHIDKPTPRTSNFSIHRNGSSIPQPEFVFIPENGNGHSSGVQAMESFLDFVQELEDGAFDQFLHEVEGRVRSRREIVGQ